MSDINQRLIKALRAANGAAPWVVVVQRRYPSRRSTSILDAMLQYDLRTAFPPKTRQKQAVKLQPQWLEAIFDALANKRSNLQVSVGAIFPYQQCKIQKSRELLDYVAKTWIACKPLTNILLNQDEKLSSVYDEK
jgi:hypothetical protein